MLFVLTSGWIFTKFAQGQVSEILTQNLKVSRTLYFLILNGLDWIKDKIIGSVDKMKEVDLKTSWTILNDFIFNFKMKLEG